MGPPDHPIQHFLNERNKIRFQNYPERLVAVDPENGHYAWKWAIPGKFSQELFIINLNWVPQRWKGVEFLKSVLATIGQKPTVIFFHEPPELGFFQPPTWIPYWDAINNSNILATFHGHWHRSTAIEYCSKDLPIPPSKCVRMIGVPSPAGMIENITCTVLAQAFEDSHDKVVLNIYQICQTPTWNVTLMPSLCC